MTDIVEHSKTAWEIASRYSGVLASETRDLAAAIDRALAAERLRAASEWRDISTAPRDGQLAIVYRPLAHKSGDQPVAVKRLIEGNHHCWNSTVPPGEEPNNPTADGSCHVTHWQPLPAPPQRNEVKK